MKYDVVVLGCGAAGIGAAYALKGSGLSVLLIDKLSEIGGAHLNAWVNVHAATPAPPFLDLLLQEMIAKGDAMYVNSNYQVLSEKRIDYYKSYFTADLIGEKESIGICFNIERMRERYIKDLSGIPFLLNTTFTKAGICRDGNVESIIVSDKDGKQKEIKAAMFIDCSADDVLIRNLGEFAGGCYAGVDSRDRYLEKYGFKEEHNKNIQNSVYVNDPTLVYGVQPGTEDLSFVQGIPPNDALVYKDSRNNYLYVNTIDYLQEPGHLVYNSPNGEKEVYRRLKQKTIRHWKTIKYGGAPRFAAYPLQRMRFVKNAPILGIRETYRALCEKMLSEPDMLKQVSMEILKKRTGLDSIIAVGSHPVDIHDNMARSNIEVREINRLRKMYGVAYGSLVPLRLKNVLVASRGAGFTHIAASSFRLNKNMMQLGWVAGKAALLFKDDFRKIDFKKLQDLIGIQNVVALVERYLKESERGLEGDSF